MLVGVKIVKILLTVISKEHFYYIKSRFLPFHQGINTYRLKVVLYQVIQSVFAYLPLTNFLLKYHSVCCSEWPMLLATYDSYLFKQATLLTPIPI